ncbi:Ypk2p [Rhizophagus irregularis DAOM 197198w]|uniref:Ypk2p n=1 Tax=Rhizophagus irregularis (strain DAOM 197198w) TaxID=1432141 RepID=A0A015J713_RHIIW|nr:Ypk2p [Rhizophagus irregularis DAOM 197198w]
MEVYRANWIDGYIYKWDDKYQNLRRLNQDMLVTLKGLINIKNVSIEFMNKIGHKFYGITQNPETKSFMIVLNNKCKKCNNICNTIHFQHKFIDWTSGNKDIDKFIQDTQISVHEDNEISHALEWIPYDRFYDIKYIGKIGLCRANWIDGKIYKWDDKYQNWGRLNQDMFVTLESLINPKNVSIEFMNKFKVDHEFYGITQNLETKNYMMVLNNKCKKCNYTCNAMHFQRNFENWTSGDKDIDKFIQDTQLTTHKDDEISHALEWIPYDRFYGIKYIGKIGVCRANWIDGYIHKWDDKCQNWRRLNQDMFVTLESLINPKNVSIEFMNKIKVDHEFYGITQNPKTKNYAIVSNSKCKKCNSICDTIYFQHKFIDWTSGNDDIDKFIQDSQLLAHNRTYSVIEWIPYNRFYDIEYIAKGGFGKVYKANWIDGCIRYRNRWDNENQNWKREDQNMFVALKSLNNSKNVTSEFMNEIKLHNKVGGGIVIKFYGITQDPETKNYIMVLEYADSGSLRHFLNTRFNELSWFNKITYLCDIAFGLRTIHENELIHRDLHTGNILVNNKYIKITDMGLCKPANYNASKNTKNCAYGVLPYIAPEILRGRNYYTKAADIYSFGIIVYEVISGLPPYYDVSHNNHLAIKICHGLRPRFNIKVPELIVNLIKRCLDADPLNRPTAKEIYEKLDPSQLLYDTELRRQIEKTDAINNILLTENTQTILGLSYKTHSEAIYTSRSLDFNNLPEPKNSDDYYEKNDNIISEEFSESLQLRFSQLNIDKNESLRRNLSQLSTNENESLQINISQLNINENESLQINISQLNINVNENS